MTRLFSRLPERFQWTAHNLVAHPVAEILFQLGYDPDPEREPLGVRRRVRRSLRRLGDRVHDWTVPLHDPGTGRG